MSPELVLGAYKRVNQTIQRLKEAAEFHTEVMKGYCLYYRWLTVLKDIDIASEISIKDKEMGSGEQLASDEANRREWQSSRGTDYYCSTAGSSQEFNSEAELADRLNLSLVTGKVAHDYSADEVDGWEFDELEKELQ
ncbi:hypothetical protein Bca101_016291 [Brassica carinata]